MADVFPDGQTSGQRSLFAALGNELAQMKSDPGTTAAYGVAPRSPSAPAPVTDSDIQMIWRRVISEESGRLRIKWIEALKSTGVYGQNNRAYINTGALTKCINIQKFESGSRAIGNKAGGIPGYTFKIVLDGDLLMKEYFAAGGMTNISKQYPAMANAIRGLGRAKVTRKVHDKFVTDTSAWRHGGKQGSAPAKPMAMQFQSVYPTQPGSFYMKPSESYIVPYLLAGPNTPGQTNAPLIYRNLGNRITGIGAKLSKRGGSAGANITTTRNKAAGQAIIAAFLQALLGKSLTNASKVYEATSVKRGSSATILISIQRDAADASIGGLLGEIITAFENRLKAKYHLTTFESTVYGKPRQFDATRR